ncbi:MAG: CcdB family protein [Magnetococcales bacterium]|nr:CcdB family protein [Magnetococcales bacterium]MBF0151127.1 CcdB family protein [Magnetococcales bacterium]MBF0174708.1 CcdB family protein [Magnetococcales bacterium]MBF0346793.1 CcdB family protein [Magnetococcales bacterium]MBF0630960.1 CcdB family protein [Magnetococcales bacterium]
MARFDLYEYRRSGSQVAFLVEVQSDLLHTLKTRVVIPLYPVCPDTPLVRILNPTVDLAGGTFFLSTAEMAAVRHSELKEVVGSLSTLRREIIAAVDLIFTGI